jgi:hypothetical protein
MEYLLLTFSNWIPENAEEWLGSVSGLTILGAAAVILLILTLAFRWR